MKEKIFAYRKVFAAWLVTALILYAGYIRRILPNPDALWNSSLYKQNYLWEASIGRWMLLPLSRLYDYVISTEAFTILSLLFLCMTATLFVDLLSIRRTLFQYFAGILWIAAPAVQGGLSYYYLYVHFSFGQLLMMIAAYALLAVEWKGLREKVLGNVLAWICMVISLSIYQVYVSVLAVSLILFYLARLLDEEEFSFIKEIKRAGIFVLITVAGFAGYLISNQVAYGILGISAADRMNNFHLINLFRPSVVGGMYVDWFSYFFRDTLLNNSVGFIPRRVMILPIFIMGIALMGGVLCHKN